MNLLKQEIYDKNNHPFMIRAKFMDPGPMWFCTPFFSMSYPAYTLQSEIILDQEEGVCQLLDYSSDFLISLTAIQHPDICSKPFIKEALFLSVKNNDSLATLPFVSLKDSSIEKILRFIVPGNYLAKQAPYWEKELNHIQLETYDDYFLFSQALQNSDLPTITTRLVQQYRYDGNNRILIPIIDPELSTFYYLNYRHKHNKRIEPFITWSNSIAADYLE